MSDENKKISQLSPIDFSTLEAYYALAVVEYSNPSDPVETKRIDIANFFKYKGQIGDRNLSGGRFANLQLLYGNVINEFSIDGTLIGNSNSAIPTEKAVKTYVDTQISEIVPNQNKIFQEDSSVEVIDSTSAPGSILFTVDSLLQATIDSNGLSLAYGVSVNEISNDVYLASSSPNALVTEYAVKQYIDNHSPDRIVSGLASALVSDSTESSYFSVKVRDTFYGPDATTFTEVYFFNDSTSTTSNWLNPSNMVDGNTETFAQAGSAQGLYVQINTSNNTPVSTTRNIEKVEMRVYGRDGSGPNISAFNIYPIFNGTTTGNSQNLRSFFGPVRSWTPWIDITQDPSAPSSWQWTDVINLNTKIEAIIGSPGGGLGDVLEVNKIELKVTYTESPSVVGSVEKFRVDHLGISTQYGASIQEFSTDVTLADNSNRALPTERAVKTYVDYQIQSVRNDLDLINIRHVNSDTTAVTGDVCLVNTEGGVVNIQMLEVPDGRVIIKKISLDANPIYVTTTPGSSIDGLSTFVIDVAYKSITFLSDGSAFYII